MKTKTKKQQPAAAAEVVTYARATEVIDNALKEATYKEDLLRIFKALFQNNLTFGWPNFLGMSGGLRVAYDLEFSYLLEVYEKWIKALLKANKIKFIWKIDYEVYQVMNFN